MHSRRHRWRDEKFGDFHHPMMMFDMVSEVLRTLAVHVDVPIEVNRGERGVRVIEPQPFSIPEIDSNSIPCMQSRYREFSFTYSHKETSGLAGVFRFFVPTDAEGKLCLVAPVESLFKMFIDPDGDLCLSAPDYVDQRADLAVNLPDEWNEDELRGVYRHKFDQKPREKSYSGSDTFELIESELKWSQNGLRVGELEFDGPMMGRGRRKRGDEDEDKEGPTIADLFEHIPVPGLNAADIDLRGLWQVPLNVQRTDFQRGPQFRAFVERYYALAADMWKQILTQTGVLDDLNALPY